MMILIFQLHEKTEIGWLGDWVFKISQVSREKYKIIME